jgi:hypothetical protein
MTTNLSLSPMKAMSMAHWKCCNRYHKWLYSVFLSQAPMGFLDIRANIMASNSWYALQVLCIIAKMNIWLPSVSKGI